MENYFDTLSDKDLADIASNILDARSRCAEIQSGHLRSVADDLFKNLNNFATNPIYPRKECLEMAIALFYKALMNRYVYIIEKNTPICPDPLHTSI